VHVRVAVDVAADLVGQVDAALGDVVVAAGRPGGDVLEAAADGAAAVPAWDSRLRMPLQHVGGGRLPPICTNGIRGGFSDLARPWIGYSRAQFRRVLVYRCSWTQMTARRSGLEVPLHPLALPVAAHHSQRAYRHLI
jgi:hypothetical protein